MRRLFVSIYLSVFFLFISCLQKPNPEWIKISSIKPITTLDEFKNYIWVTTSNELFQMDLSNGKLVLSDKFNSKNSGLKSNFISSILIDKHNNKWIGTNDGLFVFQEGGVVLDKQ
jgi:ligand-binding sensor domain-containing protein